MIRRGESGRCGVGWAFMVARVLFIWLQSCGNTITPHPAGDHKGPPRLTSAALAPTDVDGLGLRLMPIGRPSRSPWLLKNQAHHNLFMLLYNEEAKLISRGDKTYDNSK